MKRLQNKSILIVDDDVGMLRALDKVLTRAGAAVTTAQNAGDAVEILTRRQISYDMVITDLRMPFVTGLTVVYAIRKIFPHLPVIVLTAFGSPDVKVESLRQGAAAILEKPLDTVELLAAIEAAFDASASGIGSGGNAADGENGRAGNSDSISIKSQPGRIGLETRASGGRVDRPAAACRMPVMHNQEPYGYAHFRAGPG